MRVKSSNLTTIFPTPFARVEFEDFTDINQRIVDYVHQCEKAGNTRDSRADNTTNWGNGFQIQLFRVKVPVIDEFVGHVNAAFEKFLNSIGLKGLDADIRSSGWIVLSRAGGYNSPHIHPHGTFSSIYHVKVPDRPAPQGYLEFINPMGSAALQSLGSPHELVAPKEGTLTFIPSYLMHAVHPFEGDGERISLNIDFTIAQSKQSGSNPLAGIQR